MSEPRDSLEADPVLELHRYREELSKKYPTMKERRAYFETVPTAEEFLAQTVDDATKDEDFQFVLITESGLPPRDELEADPVGALGRIREEKRK